MVGWRGAGAASGMVLLCLYLAIWLPSPATAADDELQVLDLTQYQGKVVVVDFWASWCAPCRRSFPWLETMQRRYADEGLVVIGVNEDNVAKDAEAFLTSFPVSFRIVPDPRGDLARQFDLIAMPSSYVIDRNGKVAACHLGFKAGKMDEYEATLRRLLDLAVADNDQGGSTATN